MRRRSVVALTAAALLVPGSTGLAGRPDHANLVGRFAWTEADLNFGGLSGLEVSEDGFSVTALSDRGHLVRATVLRDATGRIAKVDLDAVIALPVPPGPVPDDFSYDTEGLAIAADGTLYVSAEAVTRVVRYDPDGTNPQELPRAEAFATMGFNAGPEALAIGPDGALYTLPEGSDSADGSFPVHRFADGRWSSPMRIAARPGFLPVSADFGPDGKLYILERQFRGLGGFASRIRRMDPNGEGLVATEVLLETVPGAFGNLEGLSAWRDSTGALRLTLGAADNFMAVLGTELVEFRLPG
jgi:hypothetical protein